MNAIQKLTRRIGAAWRNAPRPWSNEASWRSRGNNVDAVRAILALLVIWFHGPTLLGIATGGPLAPAFVQEPLEQIHFVGFRVLCFFWLSGFLLARSWYRSPRVFPFIGRRIVRLYPAFLVCAALCFLILLVIETGANIPGWRTIWRYIVTLRLPEAIGAFPKNNLPNTLNGSLWTLLYEGWCCIGLVAIGALGVLRRGKLLVAFFCAAWLFYALHWFGLVPFPLPGESFRTWIVFGAADAYPSLVSCFLSGVVFYRYRDRIPWHPALLTVSLGGLALAIALGLVGPSIPIFGAYTVAFIAFHPRQLFPAWLSSWGVLSYGIFLYGYPVQQLWIHYAGSNLPAIGLFLLTLPPTLLFAYLSRRFVELPMDQWQRQLGKTTSVTARPATTLPAQFQVGVREGQ